MRENDPEIVADSLPTLIKTMEALLYSDPESESLGLTVGSAYIMYANAFIEGPSNRLASEEYAQKAAAKARALNFYKRGSDYIGKALERKFPKITTDPNKLAKYLPRMEKKWVSYLYWYSAGRCAAFGLNPMDIDSGMLAVAARPMLDRAFALDPAFMNGAIPDLFISFYASMPDSLGGDKSLVQPMFEKALSINKGSSPGTYIAYAMAVAVPAQDVNQFKDLMGKALAVKPDDHPDSRLMIILSQRNARWYLENLGDYFLTE
jgi:predicted anti-sigma-YlaC factor YlaD